MSELNFENKIPNQLISRFKLLSRPLAAPGKCACCGAVDRPVVDFGLDVRWFGVVYFCELCLTEIGQIIGLVPESELLEVKQDSARTFKDQVLSRDLTVISNEQLDTPAYSLRNILDALASSFYGGDYSMAERLAERTERTVPETTKDNGGVIEQEYDSFISKGPASVSSSSSDGEFGPLL